MFGARLFVYTFRVVWALFCNLVFVPCYLAWMFLVSPTYLVSPWMFNQLEQVYLPPSLIYKTNADNVL